MIIKLTTSNRNWDKYLDTETNYIRSVAIIPGCDDSQFGSLDHLVKLIANGHYTLKDFTQEGIRYIESHIEKRGLTLKQLFKY